MSFFDAQDFLPAMGLYIANDVVKAWSWEKDDDQFGKRHSWSIGGEGVEAIATVDLQLAQLTLSISERDISGVEEGRDADPVLTFEALFQFEDQTVVKDGVALPYTSQAMADVIRQFNELL